MSFEEDEARPCRRYLRVASCYDRVKEVCYTASLNLIQEWRNLVRSWRTHGSSRTISGTDATLRGWSQEQLARRSGLSRAGISAIETDRLIPSAAAALALAAALDCRVEDLFRLRVPSPANPLGLGPLVASPADTGRPRWEGA